MPGGRFRTPAALTGRPSAPGPDRGPATIFLMPLQTPSPRHEAGRRFRRHARQMTIAPRLAALTALLALAVLESAPARAADTRVSADATAAELAAFAGQVVWVRTAPDRSKRLVRHLAGATADLPLGPSPDIAGVDLGSDRRGRPLAVYARCGRPASRDCDLFGYDLGSGRERRLAGGVSSSRCDEVVASVSRGWLLYGRRSAGGCRGGLFLKRPGGRAVRVGRRVPRRIDLAGSTAGLGYSYKDDAAELVTKVVLLRLGRRSTLLAEGTTGLKEDTFVFSPAVDGGRLHWVASGSESSSVPGVESTSYQDVIRRPVQGRGRRERLVRTLPLALKEIAVDRGQIFYTADTDAQAEAGIYRMDDPLPSFR